MKSINVDIHKFGKLTVFDKSAASITLSTLWEKQTAALVFIRHFG